MLKFIEKLNKDFLVLDGAMGTELMKLKPKPEMPLELLNITDPEQVTKIHRNYVAAGAELVYTNTFQANSKVLKDTGKTVEEVVKAGVVCAKKSGAAYVALDVGPVGLKHDDDSMTFDQAVEMYKEVMTAGNDCDVIVIETLTDLYDAKAAVIAAKECSDKPVVVTMSFEKNGLTISGTDVECMAATLCSLGIDAIGINCSYGVKMVAPLIKELCTVCNLPLVFKPSADENDSPDEFAEIVRTLLPLGVRMAGGCCGTNPDYIMKTALKIDEFKREILKNGEFKVMAKREETESVICSSKKAVYLDSLRIVGDRLNHEENEDFRKAIESHDMEYVKDMAIKQVESGADILDINVAIPGINEGSTIVEIIKTVQSVVDVPLQINARDTGAIDMALRVYNGKPILYSACGDQSSMNTILPMVSKYGAMIVGVTVDKAGLPKASVARYSIAERIYRQALKHNIPKEDVIIDCLAMIASSQQKYSLDTLDAMQRVRKELGLNTMLFVANSAYGLPKKSHMIATYLTMALCYGLTMPTLNPLDDTIMAAVRSFKVIGGYDRKAADYIKEYSDK